MSEASDGAPGTNLVPNQLASLVPTFDPAKDDLTDYTKKVQLLMNMWPDGKWTELATRLILGCSGSAFQKLQLKSADITQNDKKSIQQIIEVLGGQWGQIPLEKKYEAAERALFRCTQRQDETNDSFLARADVLWQELLNKEVKLEELQAYITLRGSNLSAEDKKRVVVDSQVSTDGRLTIPRVSAAIRMLGAGFFQEITAGRKSGKLKTYDATTMVADQLEEEDDPNRDRNALKEKAEAHGVEDEIDAVLDRADEVGGGAGLAMWEFWVNWGWDKNDQGMGGACGESAEEIYDEAVKQGLDKNPKARATIETYKHHSGWVVHNVVKITFVEKDGSIKTFYIDNNFLGGEDHVSQKADIDKFRVAPPKPPKKKRPLWVPVPPPT